MATVCVRGHNHLFVVVMSAARVEIVVDYSLKQGDIK
jgi:hypothetical protein